MYTVFTIQHMCSSRALISPMSNSGPTGNAHGKEDNAPEVESCLPVSVCIIHNDISQEVMD